MSTSTSKSYNLLTGTTTLLVVLVCWQLLARDFNPLILPSPVETWTSLKGLAASGELLTNLMITVKRTLVGYGIAILAGFSLALLLRKNRFLRAVFRPLITIIQTVPPVVWLVLAIIWFGIADDLTPVFLIFVVTFPVIFINVFAGLEHINLDLVEMARVYRCTRRQIIFDIYLPALIPHLVSAVSIGLAFAWKATVFAEFFGSSNGIGFALSVANNNLETGDLFAWTTVLVGLMLLFEYLIILPVQRRVTRWMRNG